MGEVTEDGQEWLPTLCGAASLPPFPPPFPGLREQEVRAVTHHPSSRKIFLAFLGSKRPLSLHSRSMLAVPPRAISPPTASSEAEDEGGSVEADLAPGEPKGDSPRDSGCFEGAEMLDSGREDSKLEEGLESLSLAGSA